MLLDLFHFGGEYYNSGVSSFDWLKLITALCSVATLILAYRIYKTFDVHKKFAEKQLSVVFELVQDLEKIDLRICRYDEDNEPSYQERLLFSRLQDFVKSTPKEILNGRIVMRIGLINDLYYMHYQENPFLPKSIAKEMHNMFGQSHKVDTTYDEKNFLNDVFVNYWKDVPYHIAVHESEILGWLSFKGRPVETLGDYLTQMLAVKKSITSWLKKYGAEDINIE
jgi:hypothetical protein